MKISRDRFQELVSLYIDNEASAEELKLLSFCVRKNPEMRAILIKACKIHIAACNIYGKTPHFEKLRGIENPLEWDENRRSIKVIAEWLAVAALFTVCALAAPIALSENEDDLNLVNIPSLPEEDKDLLITFEGPHNISVSKNTFSILNISSKHTHTPPENFRK